MVRVTLVFFGLVFFLAVARAETDSPQEKVQRAAELYNTGYLMTLMGQYEEALRLFKKSLEVELTAEAYTFMGWTYGYMKDYPRAIEEAEKAIRIDPEFGNPYNDIGVYLMELGRANEAIPYLKKAMKAERYCCYQFAHYNLGRIYLAKDMYEKAREEFNKSLAIDPDYLPARQAIEILEQAGLKGT